MERLGVAAMTDNGRDPCEPPCVPEAPETDPAPRLPHGETGLYLYEMGRMAGYNKGYHDGWAEASATVSSPIVG